MTARLTRVLAWAVLVIALAPSARADDTRHLVVIGGIGGEAHYDELFHRWATTLMRFTTDELGIAPANVHYLPGTPPEDAGTAAVAREESIRDVLERVAGASGADDVVLLVLIGHGSARGGRVLFNIEGPDLSAAALAALLEPFDDRRLAVVNTASSSGAFIEALSRPGRVVITATASGAENLAPVFGGHFVTAFSEAADTDKDGRLSLREVFEHATGQVAETFDRGQRVRTEHALLDDNGDGVGSRSPGEEAADGAVAARWFLSPPRYTLDAGTSRELVARGYQLVDRIGQLRRRKRQMPSSDYVAELERLLVALALNRRALRAEVEE